MTLKAYSLLCLFPLLFAVAGAGGCNASSSTEPDYAEIRTESDSVQADRLRKSGVFRLAFTGLDEKMPEELSRFCSEQKWTVKSFRCTPEQAGAFLRTGKADAVLIKLTPEEAARLNLTEFVPGCYVLNPEILHLQLKQD